MSNFTDEQLAEADREIQRRKCDLLGHEFDFLARTLSDAAPTRVYCTRCHWSGSITMDPK